MSHSETQRVVAEFLGSALLLAAVVGSGIVTATDGPASAQLFQHAVVVGAALVALILAFGSVSGGHFNPAVTIADWWFGGLTVGRAGRYIAAQIAGAAAGTLATNAMFGLETVAVSTNVRDGLGMLGGEAIATGGLLVVIFALVPTGRASAVAGAVGAWIGAAIFFTASAAFANPAVTLARAVTDSFTGIAPSSIPAFLAGQAVGTVAAVVLIAWLYQPSAKEARDVLIGHDDRLEPTRTSPAKPTSTPGAP